jgi:hypothetical protein
LGTPTKCRTGPKATADKQRPASVIYTLEQLIAEARQSGSARAVAAAEQAERELQFAWDSIHLQPRYQYDDLWPAGDFNAYRWLIAEQIMAVQAAMKL